MALESLRDRRIVLVVTGGIAAYKAAELTSLLRKSGALVRVVMTAAARQFVSPLTFESLSGHPVYDELFARPTGWEMEHIGWARWAEAVVIAPATANIIAKMAHGLADDPASTLLLAYTGQVWLAPSMNSAMLAHAATQQNLELLRTRGVHLLEPGAGRLACGEVGPGRMAEPEDIALGLADALGSIQSSPPSPAAFSSIGESRRNMGPLSGRTVLVTAGPTREMLDPIRFISNRSSGKMGTAIAQEAACRGAHVILLHGPMPAPIPPGVEALAVGSARELLQAVQQHWERVNIAVFAAAVANYESASGLSGQKIKGGDELTLRLRRTPDVAGWAGAHRRPGQFLVGFAAESERLVEAAREKLTAKNLDLICANPILEQDSGFEAEQNQLTLIAADGRQWELARAPKSEIAMQLWDRIEVLARSTSPVAVEQPSS